MAGDFRVLDFTFRIAKMDEDLNSLKFLSSNLTKSLGQLRLQNKLTHSAPRKVTVLFQANNPFSETADIVMTIDATATAGSETARIIANDISFRIRPHSSFQGIVMDMTSLDFLQINISNVAQSGSIGNKPLHTLSPYIVDMAELNSFNGYSSYDEMIAYLLLKNYEEESLPARGVMLDMVFQTIKEASDGKIRVESNLTDVSPPMQNKLIAVIQIDLVSRIMMLIEDLIAIVEAIRTRSGNYYELLDRKDRTGPDLGDRINDFLNSLQTLQNTDFAFMLCYLDPNTIATDPVKQNLVKKLIDININEFRILLSDVKKFREAHKQVYRRYKHAGFPFRPAIFGRQPYKGSSKTFDFYSMVLSGSNPFNDIVFLPYSKEVIDSYRLFSKRLQKRIQEIVNSKLSCLERKIEKTFPYENYRPSMFSEDELNELSSLAWLHNRQFPLRARIMEYRLSEGTAKEEERAWYAEIDEILSRYYQDPVDLVPRRR